MRSWGWGPHHRISALIRGDTSELAPLFSTIWGHSEEASVCKSGRKLSPIPYYVITLISVFQPPEPWEDKLTLFKPPNLWYFVMAARIDKTDCLQIWMLFHFINSHKGTRQKDLEIAKYFYQYPHHKIFICLYLRDSKLGIWVQSEFISCFAHFLIFVKAPLLYMGL